MIQVKDDHILVQDVPVTIVKRVPNGRKVGSAWVFPLSPVTAYIMKGAFGDHGTYDHPIFTELSKIPHYEMGDIQLKTTPWEHQLHAIALTTIHDGCLFNMGMGTGKSMSAIGAMNLHQCRTALIVCPKAVIGVWPKQFDIHSQREYHVVRLEQRTTAVKAKELDYGINQSISRSLPLVIVVNYDSVWRDEVAKLLKQIDIDMLILDESHRVKSHDGKASKFCAEIAPHIPHRIGLTGTPMPHSPVDLFGQFRAIDVNLFGRYITPFKDRYTIKGGYQGREVVGFQNQDEMRERFNLLTYTVTTKDALPDLPDTLDVDIDLELEPKAKKLYKALEKDFIAWLEEEEHTVVVQNALGKLLRLQQMTSGYARTEEGGDIEISTVKIDALRDILEDRGDAKVVVFVRFKHDIAVVRKLCESMKLKYYELSGEKHELTKDATIKDDCEVQITQVQSGSVGVDFSKASIAVDYSVDFSLGNWLQSRARLHRPGQINKVVFYHLKCKGTVDVKIYKAFQQKQDVIDLILNEGYKEE